MADNTLYYGDNLDILRRYVEDESVDLIYLDPTLRHPPRQHHPRRIVTLLTVAAQLGSIGTHENTGSEALLGKWESMAQATNTWRLAKMNLAIRGIDANLGPEHADNFYRCAVTNRGAHRGEMRSHAY
jgi:hypothetical protein